MGQAVPNSLRLGFPFVLRSLAGPNATNCGTAAFNGDRSTVDACVVSAFRAGAPFFAAYEESDPGVEDVTLATGFLRVDAGFVFFLRWDSTWTPFLGDPPEVFAVKPCSNARVVSSSRGVESLACW